MIFRNSEAAGSLFLVIEDANISDHCRSMRTIRPPFNIDLIYKTKRTARQMPKFKDSYSINVIAILVLFFLFVPIILRFALFLVIFPLQIQTYISLYDNSVFVQSYLRGCLIGNPDVCFSATLSSRCISSCKIV